MVIVLLKISILIRYLYFAELLATTRTVKTGMRLIIVFLLLVDNRSTLLKQASMGVVGAAREIRTPLFMGGSQACNRKHFSRFVNSIYTFFLVMKVPRRS
jgi:hypothetical protein